MHERSAQVRASTYGKEPTLLEARIAEFDRGDRRRRALRRYLPVFGASCAVLFIPPHLPWFTLCNVFGLALALQRYRQERQLLALSGPCPECAHAGELGLPDRLPAIQRCTGCGAFLKLELAA